MSLLLKKQLLNNFKFYTKQGCKPQMIYVCQRHLSFVPSIYDGDQDPAPKFFSKHIQSLLKHLTRTDLDKVFCKRTNKEYTTPRKPTYKFLTDAELNDELVKANKKATELLQMPPVVRVQEPIHEIISEEPAYFGFDKCKYIFTDISFGVANENRIIVERDPEGTLKSCDHEVRKRLNQAYFPVQGRLIKEPSMFTDEEKLLSLLDRKEYLFVLDRACLQYDPHESTYHKITSITYQHIDSKMNYDLLRSTRHFGPMAFYLSWYSSSERLFLEILQGGQVREAVLLIALNQDLHKKINLPLESLTDRILQSPILLTKPDQLTEEDIDLDSKCVDCVAEYIKNHSTMKSQQELALQGFREHYKQVIEMSRGLRIAHGTS